LTWEFTLADGDVAALVPVGLSAAGKATLRLEVEAVEPASKTILEPENWGWARLSVKTRTGDADAWTPLRVYVSNERELRVAREPFGLPAVPAEGWLSVDGGRVQASIAPHGAPKLEVSGVVGEKIQTQVEASAPLLVWTADPAADWTGEGGLVSGAAVR